MKGGGEEALAPEGKSSKEKGWVTRGMERLREDRRVAWVTPGSEEK